MRSRGALLRRAWPGLFLWALAGCEVLVTGEVSTVHCSVEGAVGLPDCPVDNVCKAGTCVERTHVVPTLGAVCHDNADCAFGDFCLDPSILGGAGDKRCSRPCCNTGGCDPDAGFVCYAPALGGMSFCLAADSVHRQTGGLAPAGAACAKDNDCRSGRCDASGICLDLCCSDTSCAAGGGTCQLSAKQGAFGFYCAAPPAGKKAFFEACALDEECATGLCAAMGNLGRRCSAPCCDSESCSANTTQDPALPVACTLLPHNGAWIRACGAPLPSSKVNAVGQPCTKDTDCRSGICALPADARSSGFCTDTCCSDASCGEGGDLQCRPQSIQGSWALRCERK